MANNKPSKLDSFFGEFNNPKQTAIWGTIASVVSIFILPFALYSAGILMGIYGAYHSFRQKKWGLLLANLAVCVLAVWIKLTFHKE